MSLNQNRNYGIDLLRMLSMFMVVTLHILGQGGLLAATEVLSPRYEAAWLLELAAYCAVNCFALISGYVGYGTKYRYASLLLLWLRVVYYSIIITVVFSVFLPSATGFSSWIDALFPAVRFQYWYFTAYFCMYFFIPLVNKTVEQLSRKQNTYLVAALLLVFSVLQTVFFANTFGTALGYSGLWLVILYTVGAFIRKYDLTEKLTIRQALLGYAGLVLVTWLSRAALELATNYIWGAPSLGDWLVQYTSPTIVGAAVCLLAVFARIKLSAGTKKLVAFLSPPAFSVYLIHAHPLLWEHVLKDLFTPYADFSAPVIWIVVIATAFFICAVCTILDIPREYLFKALKLPQKLKNLEAKVLKSPWE